MAKLTILTCWRALEAGGADAGTRGPETPAGKRRLAAADAAADLATAPRQRPRRGGIPGDQDAGWLEATPGIEPGYTVLQTVA